LRKVNRPFPPKKPPWILGKLELSMETNYLNISEVYQDGKIHVHIDGTLNELRRYCLQNMDLFDGYTTYRTKAKLVAFMKRRIAASKTTLPPPRMFFHEITWPNFNLFPLPKKMLPSLSDIVPPISSERKGGLKKPQNKFLKKRTNAVKSNKK
jgi:hypothetical protein